VCSPFDFRTASRKGKEQRGATGEMGIYMQNSRRKMCSILHIELAIHIRIHI